MYQPRQTYPVTATELEEVTTTTAALTLPAAAKKPLPNIGAKPPSSSPNTLGILKPIWKLFSYNFECLDIS